MLLFNLIAIILMSIVVLFSILLVVHWKKYRNKIKIINLIFIPILALYSIVIFIQSAHYATIKNLDHDLLEHRFRQYIREHGNLPNSYDDLKMVKNDNALKLLERQYTLIKPDINFLVKQERDSFNITYYEFGYDGSDDKLKNSIDKKSTVLIPCRSGDFYIYSFTVSKEFIKEYERAM